MSASKNEYHAFGATLWYNIAHFALRSWPWIIVALASLVFIFPLHEGQITGLLWRGLAVLIPTMLLNLKIVRATWSGDTNV